MGTKCGRETVRGVENGAENGMQDEKRARERKRAPKTRQRKNKVAAGCKRSKTRRKMALFVVVEYKMLPTCKIGKNHRKRN